jgi:hypothetical protein
MFVIAAGRRGCTSFVLDFFASFFIKKKRRAKESCFKKNSVNTALVFLLPTFMELLEMVF